MHISRYERAERLRTQALEDAAGGAALLAETARGDAASVQSAWSSFVPYLAHPVMAAPAGRAMAMLDAAAAVVATGRSAAA